MTWTRPTGHERDKIRKHLKGLVQHGLSSSLKPGQVLQPKCT